MSSDDDEYDVYDQLNKVEFSKETEKYKIRKSEKNPYSKPYLIDIKWWNSWEKYINGQSEKPGRINNADLLDENKKFKKNLKENEDFVIVDDDCFNLLLHLYGVDNDEYILKGMVDHNGTLDVYPLELYLLIDPKRPKQKFEFPGTDTPSNLRKALCRALKINAKMTTIWRIPRDIIDVDNINEDDIFPLLEEDKTLKECGVESGDVIKLDTETIQKEDYLELSNQYKKKLDENGEIKDDEGPEMGGMGGGMGGGMRGMGGMGGMGGGMDIMSMMGMFRSVEDMEREYMEKAIKASLLQQKKEEDEKRQKEEEEKRKQREKEEIENQRKKIQEFANKEDSDENDEDDENYDPIDPNNLSDDDDDDNDDDDDDDDDDDEDD